MPELPEVETVRLGLAPVLTGATIARVEINRPNLRFPFPDSFANRLTGQTVISLGRRAKYLLADLSSGEVLAMHLGMTGRFTIHAPDGGPAEAQETVSSPGAFYYNNVITPQGAGAPSPHDHVLLHLGSGATIVYNDARRFGFMELVARAALDSHPLFRNIGVEPLGNALSGGLLRQLIAGKAAPLKAALLDQRLIAGLGNIYVSEALHRAGLSPYRKAGTLDEVEAGRLAGVIRDVLTEAVAAGGSTLKDFHHADGALGYFQHAFRVYDRAGSPCPTPGCNGVITRAVQSGRSTFWCESCQR
ncbi:formamidopyrimidine-DNA glycosylase [Camelimonas fluminis]|uniref:Formamidopyrimidine-DNA glycosylase n=1 Tax=Camelimonas fluminis TaxID=1576911 RepID=A0ABV7UER3_9HYPH|nr:bifunctional DNA-formamidopyrimidine glycosylase/DNA-(apurinic or apyrimidinic site) lyase [Camelimonas fluminis]GHE46053.1 formamidopyrimidine-DNA glycosylase [Camelimonas fluminis]